MTSDLSFDEFELELSTARWNRGKPIPGGDFTYARANAARVRSVPIAQIKREAPNGFSERRAAALLLLEFYGALELEHDDAYIVAFSFGLNSENCVVLSEAPYFAEVLWRMLEIGAAGLRWSAADPLIRQWAADGRLDRARLLRTLSEGLTRGYGNAVAKWMADLYRSLEATVDEHAEAQSAIRSMLRAPERGTVRLALDLAIALHAADRLDAHGFLGAAPEVAATTAINARDIIRLATESAAADPSVLDAARVVVASALGHPSRDVQKAAVAWLQANGGGEAVSDSAALLSPAIAAGVAAPVVEPVPDVPEREFRSAVEWSSEELATNLAVLLEDASDPLEIEAGLQALAALDDLTVLSSLERRARTRLESLDDVPFHVARLVLAALGEDTPPPVDHSWRVDQVLPMLTESRFEEVRQRLLRRHPPRALLASPHDSAGWVRAAELVSRMRANEMAGLPVWSSDLAAALLRLDVDDPTRQSAREAAEGAASTEAWAAIAYALGGSAGMIQTPSWWVAAARSRGDGTDEALVAAGLTLPGQARAVDSRIRVETAMETTAWRGENETFRVVRFDLLSASDETRERPEWTDAVRLEWLHDQPTVIPYRSQVPEGYHDRQNMARWVGLTWPRSTEFAASIGVMQLASSSHYGAEHPTLSATLEALAESPGEFGELGRSCVAFGLSAKHANHRAQSAEILAADLGGRLDAPALARTMAGVVDLCKVARWATALADAATISARGRAAVIELLSQLLPLLDHGRAGMSALLEVLDDELRRAGSTPSDAALLDWLAAFSGSSKAAKAAKSILGLRA